MINKSESDIAREGAEILGGATPAGAQLQDIGQFFEYVGHAMIQAAERWRRLHSDANDRAPVRLSDAQKP
ncbi:MAG: hypothetical protein QOE61_3128 [Micromonosporaceae bacterium]|nr:hypothetical protein [Micromonosporaceae bacterium]